MIEKIRQFLCSHKWDPDIEAGDDLNPVIMDSYEYRVGVHFTCKKCGKRKWEWTEWKKTGALQKL